MANEAPRSAKRVNTSPSEDTRLSTPNQRASRADIHGSPIPPEARVKVDVEDVKHYYDMGIEHTHHHEKEFEWLEAFLNACDFMCGLEE